MYRLISTVLIMLMAVVQLAAGGFTSAVFFIPDDDTAIEMTLDVERMAEEALGPEWYREIKIKAFPTGDGFIQYYISADKDNEAAVELVKTVLRKYAAAPTV